MRRSLSKLSHCSIGRPITASSGSAFSTFSGGGGGGRGRGRGSDSPNFGFSPGKSASEDSKPESSTPATPSGTGHGRGRGKPLPSSPIVPSFHSFVDNPNTPAGRGRGGIGPKPIFFAKEEETTDSNSSSSNAPKPRDDSNLPSSVISVLTGAGRGKPLQTASSVSEKPKEENRHLRPRQQKVADSGERASSPPPQRLSREDAVKKAVGILSRSDDGDVGGGRGMGGGFRGRGGRGASGFYLGDDADGEKLAAKLGPESMNTLAEGFEEMSARVLPSPMDDAYLEALHTNMMIECEPEYLMGDFESNPDIDETPPIPLRDALEKMKPFLMAYEGIKDQEEWEEVIKETMETVPLMKEIVDYYSGPDRVTAKQQQQELERVAKTLPESAPNSVKRFTERAVLSLQSNPGWGFDKKCQFMDKVVMEVSQHYK
uniref:Hydroxyproline-rich glycoprotein family protein n=1 Tax=Solanum lycopersicum TaxID=4081 RepID=A0A3Q7EMQ3_SOLLC